ncbi:MAG: glycoside hydrolase family 31 protein [Phycisphaerales bacterium]
MSPIRSAIRGVRAAGVTLVLLAATLAPAQIVSESIGDGIVRFHASASARDHRLPSMALEHPRAATGAAPADFPIDVVFGHEGDRWTASVAIDPGTSLYATGEVAGPLLRNGRVVETWNTDAYGYQDDAKSLYTSHPWVLGVRADGSAFGVLCDTTSRCEIDLTSGIVFRAMGQEQPVIVIERDTPLAVCEALGELTGTITLPPKWAIGYHQCRYSYDPESRVKEIAQGFREHDIPADVIWMDIDYMDGYRVFTFDSPDFPDPKALNDWLGERGFHNVWMIDPGVKDEKGYFVRDSGQAHDVWVKRADKTTTFTGEVWPGVCVFPDFTSADVRTWWSGLYKDFMAKGISGVWNDMNEPAVFNSPTKTMPEDNWHRADAELGGPGPHARYHNVYGMLMVQATREGVMKANPDKRPFVLSRANYIGGHRYAATWTGDNSADWYHLDVSIPMTLNLSLSGQPFCGPDIGGFAGNGDGEMFARWMGFGALFPFSRGHTAKGNIDKEPWAFGEEVEATCRRALERRYRLIPYLYTLFEESSRTGAPIARPTFFADPVDPALRSEDDSFLLGSDLLVVAQIQPSRDRVQVLPKPIDGVAWRLFDFESFDGGRDSKDPDQPRLFARPGSIIPTGPVMEYVDEKPLDPVTLIVCLDADGHATGELYEDSGEGWGYKHRQYLRTTYEAQRRANVLILRVAATDGERARPERLLAVRVLLEDGTEVRATGKDGATLEIPLP